MKIVREFTFHAGLGETFPIGVGPSGIRSVGSIAGGWVRGERINGEVVGPGGDWVVLGADGFGQVDVRAQIRTDDGANIYLHYTGSFQATQAVLSALFSDAETNYGDSEWFTFVRLECGAPQYQWVNRMLFVGQGRVAADGVEYEVSRLA